LSPIILRKVIHDFVRPLFGFLVYGLWFMVETPTPTLIIHRRETSKFTELLRYADRSAEPEASHVVIQSAAAGIAMSL
jgi:hypothetical protein